MIRSIMLVLILIFITTLPSFAGLSNNQTLVLELAYKHGNRIEWRGERWGQTFASIIFQESKANSKIYQKNGVIVGDFDRRGRPKSLGPAQMQIPTARDLERWYPILFKLKFGIYSPTDEELIIALLTDIEFNIQCGARYFEHLINLKQDWRAAVLAYNRGPGGKGDPNDYVSKVIKWRRTVIRPLLIK